MHHYRFCEKYKKRINLPWSCNLRAELFDEEQAKAIAANFEVMDDDAILEATVAALIKGKAIGWFQGRMEFGPRALGYRSILADPRDEGIKDRVNKTIKF